MDKLTDKQRKQLYDALLDAFRNRRSLAQMVNHHWDGKNLEEIAGGDTLSQVVSSLIDWAEEHSQEQELIQAARAANRTNRQLRSLTWALEPPAPPSIVARSTWPARWRFALIVVVILISVLGGYVLWPKPGHTASNPITILVAQFDKDNNKDGQDSFVTAQIIEALQNALTDENVTVQPLPQHFSAGQEADVRKAGKAAQANFVIWGWYGALSSEDSADVEASTHFEVVETPRNFPDTKIDTNGEQAQFQLADLKHFNLQNSLSKRMVGLGLFIVGLSHYSANDWSGAIDRFNRALTVYQDSGVNADQTNTDELTPDQRNQSTILYYRGMAYSAEKATEQAIQDYTAAIGLNPQFAEAFNNRGVLKNTLQDCNDAFADFNQALSINPDYAEAHYNRGTVWYLKGDYQQALGDYDQALKLNPDYTLAHLARAQLLTQMNQTERAATDYDSAAQVYSTQVETAPDAPVSADSYYNLGNVEQNRGDYTAAIDSYTRAIALQPDFWKAYNDRGHAYFNSKDYKSAMNDYQKVSELYPDYAGAYYDLGKTYKAQGDLTTAFSKFNEAIKQDPKFKTGYWALAQLYREQQQFDLALKNYASLLDLETPCAPEWDVYIERAGLYDQMGQYENAEKDYTQAIAEQSQRADTYLARSRFYQAHNQYDSARKDLDSAIALNKDDPTIHYQSGMLYLAQQDDQHALLEFDQAITLDQNYFQAYYDRGRLHLKRGEYKAALDDFHSTIAANPDFAEVYRNLADLHLKMNDYQAALDDYAQLITQQSNVAQNYYELANLYQSHGDTKQALQEYDIVIKAQPNNPDNYFNRGLFNKGRSDLPAALDDFAHVIQLDPKSAASYRQIGSVYQLQDKIDLALENYNKALQADDKFWQAYEDRGHLHYDRNEFDLALQDYNQVVTLNSAYAGGFHDRGRAREKLNDLNGALDDFNKAITLEPALWAAYMERATIYIALRKCDDARADLQKIADGDPNSDLSKAAQQKLQDGCPLPFSDIHPDDYFFKPIQYLFYHAVVSGYADNTFLPYSLTSRGQIAKLLVNAMAWPVDTKSGPHFKDVPADSPFYDYTETAYKHGIIAGYDDQTFRPYAYATRGQIAKMIVLAQSWDLRRPANPTFGDVAPNDAFYAYIETAYQYGIVSGYADGTFRRGNNASRGQTGKILYLAVAGTPTSMPGKP